MNEELMSYGIGVVLGVLAWVLPYRWNPFRFKWFISRRLSEKANRMVPKVVGTFLIAVSVFLAIGHLNRGY